MNNELIGVLGGVITFLLTVNLFYFKDIAKRLVNIELEIAKLSTNSITVFKVIDSHDIEIHSLRERLHKLEGSLLTAIEHIKSSGG